MSLFARVPGSVSIYEVSPRDGLQNERATVPLHSKLRLIDALVASGLKRIEITSFVSPGAYAPGVRLLAQLCEPVLRLVRRVIPSVGQLDLSFLWLSIAIVALLILLR